MNRASRLGTALSAVAIAAVISGCAAGQQSRESIFGSKVDRENIGLATRAQAALAEGQLTTAVSLAERAVENTPNDAGFRALLANCYFAAGRFASAEAAYVDSLTLIPGQPELILKLALVQIAQGKKGDALSVLAAAQDGLDPANFGLALALAGRPHDAVAVLNQIARLPEADSRVRQNLALAYGLAGDWSMARTVAAQDVPPEQLDSRVQQWMAMATPARPADQVAALTGVTPAADQGMPQRLALNSAPRDNRAYAQTVMPQVAPQPQPQPEPQVQQFAEIPAAPPSAYPEPMVEAPIISVPAAPAIIASAPPAPVAAPDRVVAQAVQALVEPVPVAEPASPAEAKLVQAVTKPAAELPTSFDAPIQTASYVKISDNVRKTAAKARRNTGKSSAVVQLGAYSSPERVSVAWSRITQKYPALRDYMPMRARFDGAKGTVWRLSIKGFSSQREAIARCELLQRRGGSCFVRTAAGDSPVQLASR